MATMSELEQRTEALIERHGHFLRRRAVGAAPPSTTFKSEAWALFLGFAELLRDADPTLSYASSVERACRQRPGLHLVYLTGLRLGERRA